MYTHIGRSIIMLEAILNRSQEPMRTKPIQKLKQSWKSNEYMESNSIVGKTLNLIEQKLFSILGAPILFFRRLYFHFLVFTIMR